MQLNYEQILEYQKNRAPYLMIDHVNEVIPGKKSSGYKKLELNEWFFKVHWENDPNMPGMLQIESLVQMCSMAIFTLEGLKGKTVFLSNVDKVRFKRKVVPGDKLELSTEIISFKRGLATCSGIGSVNNSEACKALFTLVLKENMPIVKK